MAEASKDESGEKSRRPSSSRSMNPDEARNKTAQVVRIVCTVIAVILALGAILVAFRNNVNPNNGLVQFVTDVAGVFDGPFSRTNGIFTFVQDNGSMTNSDIIKSALVNWGIGAIVWLVIGRVLDRVIRVGS